MSLVRRAGQQPGPLDGRPGSLQLKDAPTYPDPKMSLRPVALKPNAQNAGAYVGFVKLKPSTPLEKGYQGPSELSDKPKMYNRSSHEGLTLIKDKATQSMKFLSSHQGSDNHEDNSNSTGGTRILSGVTDPRARPRSRRGAAVPTEIVHSKISPSLKIQLRQHVPMYRHREMGEIVYTETTSKIVNQIKASTQYRGMIKPPKVVPQFPHHTLLQNRLRLLSRGSMRAQRRELLTEAALEGHSKPKSASFVSRPISGNASIIGKDYLHDKLVQHSLKECFNSKTYLSPYQLRAHSYLEQGSAAYPNPSENSSPGILTSAKHIQLSSVSNADPGMEYCFKKPHFTVWDNVRLSEWLASSKKDRTKKVLFEHDTNFLTLARVDSDH